MTAIEVCLASGKEGTILKKWCLKKDSTKQSTITPRNFFLYTIQQSLSQLLYIFKEML